MSDSFELNTRTEIRFKATTQAGKEVELTHHLRNPNAAEYMEYEKSRFAGAQSRISSSGKGTEKQSAEEVTVNLSEAMGLDALDKLWRAICEKVDGYTTDGNELDCTQPGWKEKVPLPHRIAAARTFVENYGRTEKN